MKTLRKELQPFNMAHLEEIFEKRKSKRNDSIFRELKKVMEKKSFPTYEWERLEGSHIIGSVWKQPIGEFYYKRKVHIFEYLYIGSCGLVINWHGHHEKANEKQKRKIKEWYIFSDGSMKLCDKDELHRLINDEGHPIYVISVKEKGRGHRSEQIA